MTKAELINEKNYQISMCYAKSLNQKGIISKEDLLAFDTIMLKKYRPILGILFSEISLQ